MNTTPQLNLHFTDPISTSESDGELQHDCLQFTSLGLYSVIYYCMSESSSKFDIQKNDLFPTLTFADLSKQNISSQQLYLWSAPIDLIEQYQFYLNELSVSTKYFYNCTLPRFGPMCQYEFDYRDDNDLPVYDIESILSATESFSPTTLTCYMHLVCNRSSILGCLDWTEICDGHINCLNGGIDEKHCWELEINDCKDDEYRCHNGQCIPWHFLHDHGGLECVDKTDEYQKYVNGISFELTLYDDDTTCTYTFLSSSCVKHRHFLLVKRLFSIKEDNVSDDCWSAFICALQMFDGYCPNSNNLNENIRIVEEMCPDILKIPSVPDLFDGIHFVYVKNNLQNLTDDKYWDFYLCPKNSLISKTSFNNTTCYYHMKWMLDQWSQSSEKQFFGYQKEMLHKYDLMINHSFVICNRRDMYQCINSSKCISIYRLMDSINDCPYADDEHDNIINNIALQELFKRKTFKCPGRDKKYILLLGFRHIGCSCGGARDEICAEDKKFLSHVDFEIISFATICDGFIDLQMMTIDGRNETDENECEQWPCNNTYTRCDGIWQCIDGSDELGCDLLSPLNCSSNQHICISPYTNELVCLSIKKTNDGIIDCLGGIDEPKICRRKNPLNKLNKFRCLNDSSKSCIDSASICDSSKDCLHGDDEQFCKIEDMAGEWIDNCQVSSTLNSFDMNQFICRSLEVRRFSRRTMLSLEDYNNANKHLTTNVKSQIRSSSSVLRTFNDNNRRCNRGIDMLVWLDTVNNLTKRVCFCPSSYYGDKCQYQNQRVKLILEIYSSTNSHRTVFAVVASLVDDDDKRIIHSYHKFTYNPTRDCYTKFQIHLTYSTRPKNPTKNYSIHIDFYEKHSLGYQGSLLIPILFPFLPVHRLAFYLPIPSNNDSATSCSIRQCIHGKCIKYFNNSQNAKFCQCNRGWSGQYCDILHTSMCSSDSVYIGVSTHNRSVCVCPIHKFGPRCLLINTICQNNQNSTCRNGGQCIPYNEQTQSENNDFTCLCPKGFYGKECLPANKQLALSFGKDIVIPQSIIIHFIDVNVYIGVIRTTMFETISIDKNTTIIDLLHPFQILLTEFEKYDYYLTAVEKIYNKSGTVIKTINSSDRCRHINELFNNTIIQLPLIRRIKYYHLPCQTYSRDLSCFYDDVNLCLCYDYDQQRLANCFYFNHIMISNCYGFSDCENGAQCFQQRPSCPEKAVCVCPPCFYGLRCQFTTSGFGLSLDSILGYHIQPNINIIHQSFIVQMSAALNIIFIIAGFINGILSLITFKNKPTREVGCGVYLLSSSITTLLTMIMFALKYWILVLSQIGIIKNRSFLLFQCYSFDFILRLCLYMGQLLNSCVASERAVTAIQGTRFSKKKSKQIVKFVIPILLIITIGTNIHDPIHRHLINEENENEKRTWCIVRYSPNLQKYNSAMHIIHFFVPFIINIISSFILITKKSRQQTNMQTQRTYQQILKKQFQEHKHLFIAPIVLIILAIPHLIIAFTSKCMKSANNQVWLYLIGYFISFIPSMITFIIFIIPSKFYKKQFRKTIVQYRNNVRRRLDLTS